MSDTIKQLTPEIITVRQNRFFIFCLDCKEKRIVQTFKVQLNSFTDLMENTQTMIYNNIIVQCHNR